MVPALPPCPAASLSQADCRGRLTYPTSTAMRHWCHWSSCGNKSGTATGEPRQFAPDFLATKILILKSGMTCETQPYIFSVYVDRTAGGHRDHRYSCGNAFARVVESQGASQ